MKKFLLISILSVLIVSGCSKNILESDLKHKEKCSVYLKTAQDRIKEENIEYQGVKTFSHIGTYYSKSKQSCITKYRGRLSGSLDETIYYYNELTGSSLGGYSKDQEENRMEFEQDLQLVK
ncbi:hypothetical protein HQ544_01990 [Candidatus Falkowbacteria bacterium]|nr:hypothetical protein [Candidatus Falkowbacteria bacterium]